MNFCIRSTINLWSKHAYRYFNSGNLDIHIPISLEISTNASESGSASKSAAAAVAAAVERKTAGVVI